MSSGWGRAQGIWGAILLDGVPQVWVRGGSGSTVSAGGGGVGSSSVRVGRGGEACGNQGSSEQTKLLMVGGSGRKNVASIPESGSLAAVGNLGKSGAGGFQSVQVGRSRVVWCFGATGRPAASGHLLLCRGLGRYDVGETRQNQEARLVQVRIPAAQSRPGCVARVCPTL